MKKEVLIAILIGSVIGSAVAFGIWRTNKAFSFSELKPAEKVAPPQGETITPTSLVVTSPENNTILSSDKVKFEGSSTPKATIVLSSENYETITESNEDGEFKTEIELAGGINQVKVTSYDPSGNKQEISLTIVYSTEFE